MDKVAAFSIDAMSLLVESMASLGFVGSIILHIHFEFLGTMGELAFPSIRAERSLHIIFAEGGLYFDELVGVVVMYDIVRECLWGEWLIWLSGGFRLVVIVVGVVLVCGGVVLLVFHGVEILIIVSYLLIIRFIILSYKK